jgi:O-antigen ligase
MNLLKIAKRVFLVLAFLLPANLGKHYVLKDSYVYGRLVDYLIPTIYVQDILVVLLLALCFVSILQSAATLKTFRSIFLSRFGQLLLLFIFTLFLSALGAERTLLSLSSVVRTALYGFVCLFMVANFTPADFVRFMRVSMCSVFLLSILGVAQFFKQGSVFNNYLALGEQPYSALSRGVIEERVFGKVFVPPYGLFRHPNVFGGYLSIFLVWVLSFHLQRAQIFEGSPFIKKATVPVFILGGACLLLTLSFVAYLSLFLGVMFLFGYKFLHKYMFVLGVVLFVFLMALPLVKPDISVATLPSGHLVLPSINRASFYRRANLLLASQNIIQKNILFGVGYSLFTVYVEDASVSYRDPFSIRFVQPVHNIYALLFAEAGLFSLGIFLWLFLTAFKQAYVQKSSLLITLFQVLLLGCLDHYLLTQPQTHLLLWIVLGWSLLPGRVYEYN